MWALAHTWAFNDLKGLELSSDIYDSWSLNYLLTLGCCIYCLGISIGMAKLKNGLCFANSANAQDIRVYICLNQATGLNQPLACWGEQSHLYSVKKLSDRKNEFCHFLIWNLYTKRTCCSRPTIKDCKWTVQFNQWLTLWDQFTNNLFHANIFKKPSWSSKLATNRIWRECF